MHAASDRLRKETNAIATTIAIEMGKPIRQARGEVRNVADLIDYFAEEGLRVMGEIPKLDLANELPLIVKDPVGVVAAITPFNYPLALLTWKLGPALACGCSVVAKPDERAPSAAIRLAELFLEAGLPAGVFQVVTGGAEVGRLLASHRDVDKIAFTGGVETGRLVGAAAVGRGKRVSLELGGQCPALVDLGSDLDAAVPPLVEHAFNNSGQYCYRINRIYAVGDIYDALVARLVAATEKLLVAPGPDERSDVGPLCGAANLARSERHIADAVSLGARVLTGGHRLTEGAYESGWYSSRRLWATAPPTCS